MRIATTFLSLLLLVLPAGYATGQVMEEWVARYEGPGDVRDEANDIAIDAAGNIYVTGESGDDPMYAHSDYMTVKYDPDGNQLWASTYAGEAGYPDVASEIAVDTDGNVYVTGTSRGSNYAYDIATVKYDADGNELWVARYDGPAGEVDEPYDMVLDGDGSVYITGESEGVGTETDYVTIKYDTDGNELWVARHDGPAGSYDGAKGIALTPDGRICVTGRSAYPGAYYDYHTIMYDAEGDVLWTARYGNSGYVLDAAYDVAIHSNGDVLVTGRSRTGETWESNDFATVRYDRDGNELWVARYNGPGDNSDAPGWIAVDADGYAYVAGNSRGDGTNIDYAVIKYDPDGAEVWVARHDSPASDMDSMTGLALADDGSTYVTGFAQRLRDQAQRDYMTVKFDAYGETEWEVLYDGPGAGPDKAQAIVLNPAGEVFITGDSWGVSQRSDYATIKYVAQVTPVEGSLTAAATESGSILVRWVLASQSGIVSLDVFRATRPGGPFVRANETPLPPESPGAFEDESVWPGTTFWYELRAEMADGGTEVVGPWLVSETTDGLFQLALHSPFPNPAHGATTLVFDLPNGGGRVDLAVYTVRGQLVRTLVRGSAERGRHTAVWDGADETGKPMATGVYFIRLAVSGSTRTEKLLMMRDRR
jgi:uncharacterized delta-60 repeat protein